MWNEGGTAMRSRVVLVGLTVSAADTRVNCGGLSAVLCYTDGIGALLPSDFIDTFPIESLNGTAWCITATGDGRGPPLSRPKRTHTANQCRQEQQAPCFARCWSVSCLMACRGVLIARRAPGSARGAPGYA